MIHDRAGNQPSVPPDQLTLVIDAGSDVDAEEVARLTQQLRTELLELDVENVVIPSSTSVPAGSKSADALTWGTLLVSIGAAKELLPVLVDVIQAWLARREQLSITMEVGGDKLVLTGVSSQQVQPFIDQWLARHAAK